jgi:hypothetical protein
MKHILDRLKFRAEEADTDEMNIMLSLYKELLDEYAFKEIKFNDINNIIQHSLNSSSLISTKDLWKLKTLSEIYYFKNL